MHDSGFRKEEIPELVSCSLLRLVVNDAEKKKRESLKDKEIGCTAIRDGTWSCVAWSKCEVKRADEMSIQRCWFIGMGSVTPGFERTRSFDGCILAA